MLTSFFTLKKDIELKERTFQAISDLETEIKAMHSLRSRLQSTVNDALTSAMKSDNKELATHYIEEYDDLVSLLNIVKSAEMLLQNLSVKIDSARYLNEFVVILETAMSSLRVIKSDISRIVPEVDNTLDTISNSIREIKADLKIKELTRQRDELPTVMPEIGIELPAVRLVKSNSAINLTSFTTAVHTLV
jgi:valyl-tRNA synthetase